MKNLVDFRNLRKDKQYRPKFLGYKFARFAYFQNDWGVSVIKSNHSYGGSDDLYEIAILANGVNKSGAEGWELKNWNPFFSDAVEGWKTAKEITKIMRAVAAEKNYNEWLALRMDELWTCNNKEVLEMMGEVEELDEMGNAWELLQEKKETI